MDANAPLSVASGVTLNLSGRLAPPPNHLDIDWSPVPGAVHYTAAGGAFTVLGWFDTTARASVTAAATRARVGGVLIGRNRRRVTAFEWDPTRPRTEPYPEPVPETLRSATVHSEEGLEVGRRLTIDPRTTDAEDSWDHRPVGRIDIEPGNAYWGINSYSLVYECGSNFADGEIVTPSYDVGDSSDLGPIDLIVWDGDCAGFDNQPVCVLTMNRDMGVSVEIDLR